jgi:hypothetical protein
MTNDECPMTKECRMTNAGNQRAWEAVRHSFIRHFPSFILQRRS